MQEQHPVQTKLLELTKNMVHVVQPCNDEKGLIEDEFVATLQYLESLKVQICTDKARIEG